MLCKHVHIIKVDADTFSWTVKLQDQIFIIFIIFLTGFSIDLILSFIENAFKCLSLVLTSFSCINNTMNY